ncbi:hypothetical protein DSY14_03720 [Nocardiopsis sp. MG754419]|nr:hypothetical protein [Nocardiopsis sp. MG754419]
MHRDDAWDALERARAMDRKVRPMGGWYAIYGIAFGMTSLGLLLTMGVTNSGTGAIIGSSVALPMIFLLITYANRQPVTPRGYGHLHLWSLAAWTAIYGTTIFVGMYVFPGDLTWWVPMAVVSALPSSIAGLIALRRSRSAQ